MKPMSDTPVSRMAEDHLTLIWKAYERPGGEPSTTDLAAQLRVRPSTVSANLKKLARDGLIDYEPYGRITLTEAGQAIAVSVVRRHRIIETYLVDRLGLGWEHVHDEADRLEHAVSDLVLDRMDEVLGRPTADPHGDPIPAPDGTLPPDVSVALRDAPPGTEVRVARVSDRSADVLRYLHDRGVVLGTHLEVIEVSTATGTLAVRVEGQPLELSLTAADAVRVRTSVPPS